MSCGAARSRIITPRPGLDIGAGIGVLHHELLDRGTRSAVHVEVARAYVDAARRESERRGHAERVKFLHGDLLALGPSVDSADLVTLDRVVCCYAALEPLVRLSAEKARRYYALSFPHDRWYVAGAHPVAESPAQAVGQSISIVRPPSKRHPQPGACGRIRDSPRPPHTGLGNTRLRTARRHLSWSSDSTPQLLSPPARE